MTNVINDYKINLVKKLIQEANNDIYRSLCWYEYEIIPRMNKYKTPIDGDFYKRTWYFILRQI